MFKFCSLYSGSSGNSLFVQTDNTKILVDAGESAKKIETALNSIDVNINDIDGNTITAIIEDNEFFIRKGSDGFYKLFDKYNNIYNPNRNFIEDLYNYECWALWSQKELIYCYNGQINVYSKPSAKLEKLFDNYQEEAFQYN